MQCALNGEYANPVAEKSGCIAAGYDAFAELLLTKISKQIDYGSIGGIIVLLLWLFITAFVVLLGAEIHAQNEADASRLADS